LEGLVLPLEELEELEEPEELLEDLLPELEDFLLPELEELLLELLLWVTVVTASSVATV
jgi:hypothetical protein